MAHKTLVGGTAYNVAGGRSMVSGTVYNVAGGRTLVEGTGYNVSFKKTIYAMLYSSGNLIFQNNNSVISGESLVAEYVDPTNFEDTDYQLTLPEGGMTGWIVLDNNTPWNGHIGSIYNVKFSTKLKPKSISNWFYEVTSLKSIDYNNLNLNLITNMSNAFYDCFQLTGSPVCGPNVVDMSGTYCYCVNLTGNPACGNNVTNMYWAYQCCYNLTGSPVCGVNVTNMCETYYQCYNLTGSPVCGNKVTDMSATYSGCSNLTGSPICGPNVTDMSSAYRNCYNLTGRAVCGPNVTSMAYAYYNCVNLTGIGDCYNKVTNMAYAYYNCLSSSYFDYGRLTIYIYSPNITNARNCFGNKRNSCQLILTVPSNSTTFNTFTRSNTQSIVGNNITWTRQTIGGYNTWINNQYNITIRLLEEF